MIMIMIMIIIIIQMIMRTEMMIIKGIGDNLLLCNHPLLIGLWMNTIGEWFDGTYAHWLKQRQLSSGNCIPNVKDNNNGIELNNAVVFDLNYDDTNHLSKPHQSSIFFCKPLRRWLYRHIFTSSRTSNTNANGNSNVTACQCLSGNTYVKSIREIVCFPDIKRMKRLGELVDCWRQGTVVEDIESPPTPITTSSSEDDLAQSSHSSGLVSDNPLLRMKCYTFVQECLQRPKSNEKDNRICISEEMLLDDIAMLWKWIIEEIIGRNSSTGSIPVDIDTTISDAKQDHINSNSNANVDIISNANVNDNVDNVDIIDMIGMTDPPKTNDNDNSNEQKNEIEHNTQINQRRRALKAEKVKMKREVLCNSSNGNNAGKISGNTQTKVEKCDKLTMERLANVLTNRLDRQIFAYLNQWKYRKQLTEIKKSNSRASAVEIIHPLDMHARSVLLHIYEIVFIFLHLQCQLVWYPSFITHFLHYQYRTHVATDGKNNETEDDTCSLLFKSIPSMLLKTTDEHQKEINKTKTAMDSFYQLKGGKEEENGILLKQWSALMHWRKQIEERFDQNDIMKHNIKLTMPYIWDIFDTKLYHWICNNHSLAKKTIDKILIQEIETFENFRTLTINGSLPLRKVLQENKNIRNCLKLKKAPSTSLSQIVIIWRLLCEHTDVQKFVEQRRWYANVPNFNTTLKKRRATKKVTEQLKTMGFGSNYIERALKIFQVSGCIVVSFFFFFAIKRQSKYRNQKTRGSVYDVATLTEIIHRLKEKDEVLCIHQNITKSKQMTK
ncbi:hypothetical protein RFI_28624 [Reticulomyxa filosa]|uniref:Uncharacterized protein n=1 Tax=Reticulomyxa filosa TaxID=46433 RepID=X6M553_RETFI|nr:hypothetical protein RFI_28624 [Reticulomyxa filosa]|eukprot:ETO08761.1 hypothetical protein RFI_28624 [Reticulomyxa filosa]